MFHNLLKTHITSYMILKIPVLIKTWATTNSNDSTGHPRVHDTVQVLFEWLVVEGGERMVGGGDVQIQPHRPLCLACTSWNMVWHSSMYSSYKLSRRVAAAICSWRAGTSNATAQLIVQAQCWKGTQVFPRYGFLKVITLYPDKKKMWSLNKTHSLLLYL